MKKLMTMLGVITLTVAPVVTLVSCGTDDKHLDSDGNSIILEFGKPVGDGKVVSLNSKGVLEAIKKKPSFKNKFLKDVLSFINSSFLANLGNFFVTEDDSKSDGEWKDKTIGSAKNDKFKFYDDSTYSTLSNVWANVQETVDRQIEDEKEIMDDSKKWKESLVSKFPNFEDESVEFLENKYRTSLLVDGEDNVETRIQQALVDNNHSGVTFVNEQRLNLIWNDHKRRIESNPSDYEKLIKNPNNELMRREFSQLYNAEFIKVEKMKSVEDINKENQYEIMLQDIETNWKDIELGKKKANAVPDSINSLSVRGSGVNGILSNSQNYFFNNYFKTKAPVAISEVTFPYSPNAVFEEGIVADSINNYAGSQAATKITNFEKEVAKVENDRSWIQLLTNDFDAKYGGAVTKADKLITIDDEQDAFLKSVVYDYLLNNGENGLMNSNNESSVQKNNEYEEEKVDNVPWLLDINRNNKTEGSKTLYKELNENSLVYLDASGVHFIHLHGQIKNNNKLSGEVTNYTRLETFDENGNLNDILFNQQADLNKFNTSTDQEKLAAVYDYNENKDAPLGQLSENNSSIKNNYAKYLINNSLTANISNSFSTYDVVGSMREWTKASAEGSITTKLTLYDYFRNLKGESSDKEFLNEFIEFGGDNADELENMVVTMIETLRAGSQVTSAMAMEKQYNSLEKTIDAIKSNPVSKNDPPKAKFDKRVFSANSLFEEILKNFKLFEVESSRSNKEYFDLVLAYALKGGN